MFSLKTIVMNENTPFRRMLQCQLKRPLVVTKRRALRTPKGMLPEKLEITALILLKIIIIIIG